MVLKVKTAAERDERETFLKCKRWPCVLYLRKAILPENKCLTLCILDKVFVSYTLTMQLRWPGTDPLTYRTLYLVFTLHTCRREDIFHIMHHHHHHTDTRWLYKRCFLSTPHLKVNLMAQLSFEVVLTVYSIHLNVINVFYIAIPMWTQPAMQCVNCIVHCRTESIWRFDGILNGQMKQASFHIVNALRLIYMQTDNLMIWILNRLAVQFAVPLSHELCRKCFPSCPASSFLWKLWLGPAGK